MALDYPRYYFGIRWAFGWMGVWVPFVLLWIESLTLESLVMEYLDLARGRYSCREFENRSVEQAVVDAIVEAGRIAPSACNNHPSRVMVLDTPELLEKAAACQPRFARDGSIFGAPLVFLICSVTDDAWVRPYDQMNSSEIDTSIGV